MLLGAAWSYAQTPMNMKEKIKDEQVPAAVMKTFESDFSAEKNDIKEGSWYSHFEHTSDATPTDPTRSKAIPIHYSYIGKKDGKNVEIKFTPDGKFVSSKGLKAK